MCNGLTPIRLTSKKMPIRDLYLSFLMMLRLKKHDLFERLSPF